MIGGEEHDLHKRRRGRNFALLAVLLGFVVLLFSVTIAKMGHNVVKPEMGWSETK